MKKVFAIVLFAVLGSFLSIPAAPFEISEDPLRVVIDIQNEMFRVLERQNDVQYDRMEIVGDRTFFEHIVNGTRYTFHVKTIEYTPSYRNKEKNFTIMTGCHFESYEEAWEFFIHLVDGFTIDLGTHIEDIHTDNEILVSWRSTGTSIYSVFLSVEQSTVAIMWIFGKG